MKVSYNWLQSYFTQPLPPAAELARLLTMHAFEVEDIVPTGGDTVMDVKVLANRAHDCLSHRGVARELSVILERPLKRDPLLGVPAQSGTPSGIFSVRIETDTVKHFSTVVLKNVVVGPSPDWLVKYLTAIGQKSINNVVDITNYVMFDLGQPMHAFDFEKLEHVEGKASFIVRPSAPEETTVTLDGATRTIPQGSIVITDGNTKGETILGIAGVKGGKVSEISPDTRNIILEAAVFDGPTIRRTSQGLRLRTDASARFEQGIAPELPFYALPYALELIRQYASGPDTAVEGFAGMYPPKEKLVELTVSTDTVNGLLGSSLSAKDLEKVLDRLHVTWRAEGSGYTVTVPFERLDLRIPEDVIEEVGRIYGLENIPSTKPTLTLSTPAVNKNFYYSERIRDILVSEGFSEVSTYALVTTGEIELQNPLASDKKYLRDSLKYGLSASLVLNIHNAPLLGLSRIALFEIGSVFTAEGERLYLGIGLAGEKSKKAEQTDRLDRAVAALQEKLGITVGGTIVSPEPLVWEVDIGQLIETLPTPTAYEDKPVSPPRSYTPPSIYPFVLRDVAIFVPSGVSAEAVQEVIKTHAGTSLVQSFLFDTFEKEGKTSWAFRLVFQSPLKTLSDEEVNLVMNTITAALNSQASWQVR